MAENPTLPIGETTCLESDVTEIDSAKKTREVKEFTDYTDRLSIYQDKMIFEEEDFDPTVYYRKRRGLTKEKEMEMEKYRYDHEAVLKYISQIRHSGGFDVDVHIPTWLHPGLVWFYPADMSDPEERDMIYYLAKLAIREINVDMKSKYFELVEVVKAVSSLFDLGSMYYLTLAVKKEREGAATITIQAMVCFYSSSLDLTLEQWRVKPVARAVEG